MKNIILYIWYKYIGAIFRILPIKKNRIIFQNFFGKGYGDNPKFIAEELLNKYGKNVELIWLVKNMTYENIPKQIKQVKRGSIKELYYLATSKFWVDNSRKHLGIIKRKNQIYIQTWHGDLAFKRIENDTAKKLDKNYIKTAKADSKMIDIITSGSGFFTNIVKTAFWYDGNIYECGSPKTDILFKDNVVKDDKYKIALYAPTFRDDGDLSIYNIDFEKIVKELNENSNNEWKLYIRFHPNCSELQKKIKYSKNIIDGSKIDDMNKLLKSSSMLITDYSSSMFDAMYINIPVILYVPDKNKYISERGSYFEFNDLPFEYTDDINTLYKLIRGIDSIDYLKNYSDFKSKINSFEDGHASERVALLIIKIINGEKEV